MVKKSDRANFNKSAHSAKMAKKAKKTLVPDSKMTIQTWVDMGHLTVKDKAESKKRQYINMDDKRLRKGQQFQFNFNSKDLAAFQTFLCVRSEEKHLCCASGKR